MKILYSDWVFDDQEEREEGDTDGTKVDNMIEEDMEFIPSESVEKPKKRGRPRKSIEEVKSVKKPKRSAAAVKTKKNVSIKVKSSSNGGVGSQGNVINLDDEDVEVNEFEQKRDMNENQESSCPVTVASSEEVNSIFEVPNSILVKEKVEIRSIRSLSNTSGDQSFSVSDQAPGVSVLPPNVSPALPSPPVPAQQVVLRPGQPRMLKPLRAGVGRISQDSVKSEQKMDENENNMNTRFDMTNTTPEEDISLSSTSPLQSPSPSISDQGDYQAPAPPNFPVKQLSQAVLPMPGPRSSPGQILVRPAQPRMPRPPRPGMGRGSARPTGPMPAGARGPLGFPGTRLSNPRSLVPMRRSASHPQPQYFPVTSHPARYPHQEQTPYPCQSPNLSNLDVSIIREIAPTSRHGWVPPPGLTMVRVPVSATESTLTISTMATALHKLGQVEGRKRSVQYSLTEEQIRALSTLGVGQEEVGGWQ